MVVINYFLMERMLSYSKERIAFRRGPPLRRPSSIVSGSQSVSPSVRGCLYISEPLEKLLLNCVEHATFIDSSQRIELCAILDLS